jgi:hypothetical protein
MSERQLERIELRLKQLEEGGGAEKSNTSVLAEFYTAEYSVMMGRVSTWANLQYAAWPILIAAIALVAQMNQLSVSLRLWAAVILTLVVYVAYQGTMTDMLYYVLLVERHLRPRAARLIDNNDNFWIHERVRRKIYPSNPAWSPVWPPVISVAVIVAVAGFIWKRYGLNWMDYSCVAGALGLSYFVVRLTANGKRLKAQIEKTCEQSDIDIGEPR